MQEHSTQVAHAFLLEPDGRSLAQLAIDEGIWNSDG
jgi:hypothetical protein